MILMFLLWKYLFYQNWCDVNYFLSVLKYLVGIWDLEFFIEHIDGIVLRRLNMLHFIQPPFLRCPCSKKLCQVNTLSNTLNYNCHNNRLEKSFQIFSNISRMLPENTFCEICNFKLGYSAKVKSERRKDSP